MLESSKKELSFLKQSPDVQRSCSSSEGASEYDSFSFGSYGAAVRPHEEELTLYLAQPCHLVLNGLKDSFPTIQKLFLKLNTAVPSSASVERLLSVGADIFVRKRGKLLDGIFEMQLLLKFIKKTLV